MSRVTWIIALTLAGCSGPVISQSGSNGGGGASAGDELCSCVVPDGGGCMCCGADAGSGLRPAPRPENMTCCAPTCVPTTIACPAPLVPLTIGGSPADCSQIALPNGESVYCCQPACDGGVCK